MGQRGRPPTPMTERIAALVGMAANGVKPSPLENVNPFDKETELEAWRLWEYVVPELIDRYSVGKGDQPLIEGLCRHYLRFQRARLEYGDRMTSADDMGTIRKHPAVGIETEAWREFVNAAMQLGLTPMSRPRIKVPAGPQGVVSGEMPLSILSFDRDRTKGPPPPPDEVQDAG